MKSTNLKKLATLGVLAACSVVLMLAVRIPFPPAPFLEYDPADIPILIGTFLFGPIWGFGLTVVVSVLQGMTVSAGSGWIGIVMHVAATGCFALWQALYTESTTTESTHTLLLSAVSFCKRQ